MSQEERLMILQMVAENKITASEGAELLKALDGSREPESSTRPAGAGPAWSAPPEPPTPSEPPAPPNYATSSTRCTPPYRTAPPNPPASLASGFSAFIEEMAERVTSVIGDFTGPRHEFASQATGQFTADEVALRLFTSNGHVELKAWDEPGYKAEILVKVRGVSEEEARRRSQEAYQVFADESRFELESNRRFDWSDLVVNVTLYLPKGKRYRLETRTGNGHVVVESVDLAEGNARSGNGRIRFVGGSADRLYLKSGNGSIEVEGDVADLEVTTGNGSVKAIPLGRRSESMQLKTGNGSVTIDTGRVSRQAGVMIDASTGMGSISVSRTDLVYERDDRNVGHKHIICRTQAYETSEPRISIRARTGLGSIAVE